jgi:hypothetical protein
MEKTMNAMNPARGTDTTMPIQSVETAKPVSALDQELAMWRLEKLAARLPLVVGEIEGYWESLTKRRPGDPDSFIRYECLEAELIGAMLGAAYDSACEFKKTLELVAPLISPDSEKAQTSPVAGFVGAPEVNDTCQASVGQGSGTVLPEASQIATLYDVWKQSMDYASQPTLTDEETNERCDKSRAWEAKIRALKSASPQDIAIKAIVASGDGCWCIASSQHGDIWQELRALAHGEFSEQGMESAKGKSFVSSAYDETTVQIDHALGLANGMFQLAQDYSETHANDDTSRALLAQAMALEDAVRKIEGLHAVEGGAK